MELGMQSVVISEFYKSLSETRNVYSQRFREEIIHVSCIFTCVILPLASE